MNKKNETLRGLKIIMQVTASINSVLGVAVLRTVFYRLIVVCLMDSRQRSNFISSPVHRIPEVERMASESQKFRDNLRYTCQLDNIKCYGSASGQFDFRSAAEIRSARWTNGVPMVFERSANNFPFARISRY